MRLHQGFLKKNIAEGTEGYMTNGERMIAMKA